MASLDKFLQFPIESFFVVDRFNLIGLQGRVVNHAFQLIIRLGGGAGALEIFITTRQTIRALACGPSG